MRYSVWNHVQAEMKKLGFKDQGLALDFTKRRILRNRDLMYRYSSEHTAFCEYHSDSAPYFSPYVIVKFKDGHLKRVHLKSLEIVI